MLLLLFEEFPPVCGDVVRRQTSARFQWQSRHGWQWQAQVQHPVWRNNSFDSCQV